MRWKTSTICLENSHSIPIKHLPIREGEVFREVCRDVSEPSQSTPDWAHHAFYGASHKSLWCYSFMSSLEPCTLFGLSSHSCINMTEQMGPWKKRWKNRKLAIFTSEENRVWTCKWRTRDNRDKCTCHQLVNQWWKLISTRVNKGITSWTNECNRCDRVITPCSYHNREWMLGSNVHSRKGYNMKKEWRTQVTFIYIALLTIQIVSKQLSNIKIGK